MECIRCGKTAILGAEKCQDCLDWQYELNQERNKEYTDGFEDEKVRE